MTNEEAMIFQLQERNKKLDAALDAAMNLLESYEAHAKVLIDWNKKYSQMVWERGAKS